MNSQLMQVVYISNSSRRFSDAKLADMLGDFRRNNERHNITGLLIYFKQSFLQIFEGPKESVEKLWRNIRNDERHVLVTRIHYRKIDSRMFSEWSMAFENVEHDSDVYVDGHVRLLQAERALSTNSQDEIVKLISAFKKSS